MEREQILASIAWQWMNHSWTTGKPPSHSALLTPDS